MRSITRFTPMLAVIMIAALIGGCAGAMSRTRGRQDLGPGLQAQYTPSRVIVDGWLDEAVWNEARTYQLYSGSSGVKRRVRRGEEPQQEAKGVVRLAWDNQYLYLAVELEDDDIVAEGLTDQLQHHQLGDVFTVLLKPADYSWHWRLSVTPRGRKSSSWFLSPGRFGLPSNHQYDCGLHAAAKVEGTINNWRDKDNRWTAELAMPIRDLTAHGESFGAGTRWQILVARYDYSRYRDRPGPAVTMAPVIVGEDLHQTQQYTALQLVR